jgi:hypothetical protein
LTWHNSRGALRFARVKVGIATDTGRFLQIQRFDGSLAKLGTLEETTTTAKLGPGGTLPAAILRTAYREPRR